MGQFTPDAETVRAYREEHGCGLHAAARAVELDNIRKAIRELQQAPEVRDILQAMLELIPIRR